MRIGPAALDGAHGGDGHHGIAQPVRRTDQNAKGLQPRGGGLPRDKGEEFAIVRIHGAGGRRVHHDAALVGREQEFRLGRFPAIVDPEPVRGLALHLPLQRGVEFQGERAGVALAGLDGLVDHHFPPAQAIGVHRGRDNRRARAQGEQGGQRGGAREPAKERAPHTCVAGMLVHEHAHAAAVAEQLHGGVQAFLAFK